MECTSNAYSIARHSLGSIRKAGELLHNLAQIDPAARRCGHPLLRSASVRLHCIPRALCSQHIARLELVAAATGFISPCRARSSGAERSVGQPHLLNSASASAANTPIELRAAPASRRFQISRASSRRPLNRCHIDTPYAVVPSMTLGGVPAFGYTVNAEHSAARRRRRSPIP